MKSRIFVIICFIIILIALGVQVFTGIDFVLTNKKGVATVEKKKNADLVYITVSYYNEYKNSNSKNVIPIYYDEATSVNLNDRIEIIYQKRTSDIYSEYKTAPTLGWLFVVSIIFVVCIYGLIKQIYKFYMSN